jgi:predicted transcriptional regulator
MLKITPRRAKKVDPDDFMDFIKDAQFVLDRGRSQKDIAELLGISEANLSKYLNGAVKFPVTYAFINRFKSIFRNITQLRKLSPEEQEVLLTATNEEGLDFTIEEKLDSIKEDLNDLRKDVALLREEVRALAATRHPTD